MQNVINLTGTLGHDGSFKEVGDKHVVSFSVAESYYRGKDKEPGLNWWECSMWLSANQVPYYQAKLKKGVQIVVRGSVIIEKVTKDEVTKTYVKLHAKEVEALNVRLEQQQSEQSAPQQSVNEGGADGLPF